MSEAAIVQILISLLTAGIIGALIYVYRPRGGLNE